MTISIIAALGKNNVIGSEGKLPWRMRADMKRFVSLTKGKPVVMGRKTYESIGKPLKYRTNIILTRDPNYRAEGCIVVNSLEEAMEIAENEKEVMIIGGASIYKQFIPRAEKMYLTIINHNFEGDVFFPEIGDEWKETEREEHKADKDNPHDYAFVTMERK